MNRLLVAVGILLSLLTGTLAAIKELLAREKAT